MAVQAAEGRYHQAGLYPNPSMEYIADEIGNDGSEGLQGGGFSQEIVTRGKLRLGRAVAGHEIEGARHGWEAQQRRVLNDVRAGYYEVLLAQKMIEVNEELVGIGDKGVQVIEKLRAEKEVSKVDVLQARIEADMTRLRLTEARNDHRAAWRQLVAVLGRPDMEPRPLAGEVDTGLPQLDWETTIARILAQSPELAQAGAAVERARCDLALQCANRIPNFEVGSAVKQDTGSGYTVVDVGLSVPLPLFNRNQGNIIAAQANLISAQKEIQRVELDLRDRLAIAFGCYANARRQAETFSKSVLPNAKESLDKTREGYLAGEFGYVTLLTAQRTYFGVSLDYLNSLRELWARSIELEGLLLSGGLQPPE
jgi:cobalt-zinc-cadmium efflux system outer membrane protein